MSEVLQSRGIDLAVEMAGSQAKLAAKVGVTQQAVMKWVKRGFVPLPRAREIEAVLGIPRSTLADPKVLDLLSDLESIL
jgi:DNA-binding transcriptional regulator YdaS (Cro superfamily)